jgi:nicotinamidase-related amidase
MQMYHSSQMSAVDTGLLVIDVQEKLVPLIPDSPALLRNVAFLLDGARVLGIPVQATEQYPKGLGATVPDIARRLSERPDKVAFTCCAVPSIVPNFRAAGRQKIVLAGIETHVCVLQTALDLLALDFQVYIPADAVGSRFRSDHERALDRMERAGAVVTTSETAVFEWVGAAGTPQFKEVSRLVQDRMKDLQPSPGR